LPALNSWAWNPTQLCRHRNRNREVEERPRHALVAAVAVPLLVVLEGVCLRWLCLLLAVAHLLESLCSSRNAPWTCLRRRHLRPLQRTPRQRQMQPQSKRAQHHLLLQLLQLLHRARHRSLGLGRPGTQRCTRTKKSSIRPMARRRKARMLTRRPRQRQQLKRLPKLAVLVPPLPPRRPLRLLQLLRSKKQLPLPVSQPNQPPKMRNLRRILRLQQKRLPLPRKQQQRLPPQRAHPTQAEQQLLRRQSPIASTAWSARRLAATLCTRQSDQLHLSQQRRQE